MQSYFLMPEYSPFALNNGGPHKYNIRFDKEKHEYYVSENGGNEFQYPSISYILEQVFGNRFKRVKPEVLERARKKGSEVHDEILQWTIGKDVGVSPEFRAASEKIKELTAKKNYVESAIACEQILCCQTQYPGVKFCCTVDAFWMSGRLVDYKTSTKLDIAHVTRQLNLYAYALKKNGYFVNSLEAWHLNGDKLTIYPIEYKGDYYCEYILKAYCSGEKFRGDAEMLATYGSGKVEVPASPIDVYCNRLKEVDAMIDKLSATKEKLLSNIKGYMETTKRQDYVRDDIGMTVKFIPGSERKSIDTAELKEERPDLYDCLMRDFSKTTKVAPHLRVNYKKES